MNRTALDELFDAMLDDDEPTRHACWLIRLDDSTEQHIGCWPPLSRAEVMNAYLCADAIAAQ